MAKDSKGAAAPDQAQDAPKPGGPAGAEPTKQAHKKASGKSAAQTGAAKPKKQRGHSPRQPGKRFRKALTAAPKDPLPMGEALAALKKLKGTVRFNQTVELVLLLGIDPRKADQMIRGAVSLPKGIGKTRRVICFAEGDDAEKAKSAGAAEVGADELVKKIMDGWQEFDVAIAHPRMMSKVGKLGRILGPTGRMPSPKNGTVTPNVETAVREFAAGKVEFRNDAGGNVHGVIGKIEFADADLVENAEAFIEHIRRMKPATSKGTFIRKICISATMTPSVEVKIGA